MKSTRQKRLRKWGKIALINTIPLIGVLAFDWGIFELALTYLLETAVAFTVFFIDRCFIDKRSRYPFLFALIQLVFMLFPFCGLIFGWIVLTYFLTQPPFPRSDLMLESLATDFAQFDFYWVLLGFFVLEGINYAIKNRGGRKHKSSAVWFNLQKFFMVHLFVVFTGVIYSVLPHNFLTGLLFVIALKVLLDLLIGDERFIRKLNNLFNRFATLGLNEDGSVKKEED